MAEEENTEAEQPKSSGVKKIIMFAIVGLVMLGVGVGGTMFMMGSDDGASEEMAEEEMAEEEMMEEPMMKDSIYHNLHPAFVANFSGNSKKKYMQVYVVAMAHEQSVIEDLKLHMPAVRNNILMTLSKKTSAEVATVEGKEMLRQEVLETVQQTMVEKTGDEGIQDLYFTKFVAQ